MTPSRWELITKLFDAALDKPPSERMDFVHRECCGDLDLELQVRKLLAADERAGSFLEQPWLSASPVRLRLDDSPLLSPGSIISHRFEIVRMLGQGGMGQVYEAFDLEVKERIALKAIRPEISSDPRAISRFRREVQLTRRVTHPNVCRTFDMDRHTVTKSGVQSEIMFLTMELLEGETLADLLRRTGRLRTVDALPLVLQMMEALSAAHLAHVVHRDFKPSNVLLTSSGAAVRAVVTDFGLARILRLQDASDAESVAASFTGSQEFLGTLVYMAPEQIESGEATVSSDIYSLGLVMFEMVAGRRPFYDPIPFSEAIKRIKEPAPSPRKFVPDLDSRWEAMICKCLEAQLKDRFESAAEVAEFITSARPGLPKAAWNLKKPGRKMAIKPSDSHGSKRWGRRILISGMCLAVVSLFTVLLRLYEKKADPKVASGATVLLTEVQNSTGDKRFDNSTALLRRQLALSPYFNLMDKGRIADVLTQMTKPPDSLLDPPTAREVALRARVPRVIFATVSSVGDNYVLDIVIEKPDNNPRRARAQWENHWRWEVIGAAASNKEIPSAFLDAIRNSSDWIRREIGESANEVDRVDAPPEDATTGNWDALSEFAQAEQFNASGHPEDAVEALRNATVADPHFALAFMRLGDLLVSLGRHDEGYAAYQSALAQEREQRLTRREKYRLEGIYALDTEDFQRAEHAFNEYTVYYRNDYLGWFYRALPLMMMGRVEEAMTTLKKAAAIDPGKISAPAHLARYDLILGDFTDAAKWIQQLRENEHMEDATIVEGQLRFMEGQYSDAVTHFTALHNAKLALYRSDSYSMKARVFAELGQYDLASQALNEGIESDLATGDVVHRADKFLDLGYIDCRRGQYEACLRNCRQGLNLNKSWQRSLAASAILGYAASRSSGPVRTKLISALIRIRKELPSGELKPISDIVRARLNGEILLANGRWQDALEAFRVADGLEAPAKDREYLARCLYLAAQHAADPKASFELKEQTLKAYANLALRPGQAWQLPQEYLPGRWSDEVLSYAILANEIGQSGPQTISLLAQYIARRSNSVSLSSEVESARQTLEQMQKQTRETISHEGRNQSDYTQRRKHQ